MKVTLVCSLLLALAAATTDVVRARTHKAIATNVTTNDNGKRVAADDKTDGSLAVPQCALIKCSDIGTGVCGSDGQTYVNACQVLAASCNKPGLTVVSDSPCESRPPSPKCPLPQCAPIGTPVCGSNGKTYLNRCLFSYFACKDPSLSAAHNGKCEAVTQTAEPSEPMPTSCAAVMCRQFSECRVDDSTGRAYCADVCTPQRCAPNERCKLQTVQCIMTPCPPIAKCVPKK